MTSTSTVVQRYKRIVRQPEEMQAVQWNGFNLEEVQKIYPGITEEYMRDSRGMGIGDYIFSTTPGRVEFMGARPFLERWHVQTSDKIGKAALELHEVHARLEYGSNVNGFNARD